MDNLARYLQANPGGFDRRTPEQLAVIAAAKSIIMNEQGWAEPKAYQYLRTRAMNERKPLLEICSRMLALRPA